MITSNLCGPALIYLTFSFTQVVIDTIKGFYNTALFKFIISFIITILLNALCIRGLTAASWVIVFIPFITMTVITSLLLYYFGLDPASGTINVHSKNKINKKNGPDHRIPDRQIIADNTMMDVNETDDQYLREYCAMNGKPPPGGNRSCPSMISNTSQSNTPQSNMSESDKINNRNRQLRIQGMPMGERPKTKPLQQTSDAESEDQKFESYLREQMRMNNILPSTNVNENNSQNQMLTTQQTMMNESSQNNAKPSSTLASNNGQNNSSVSTTPTTINT